MRRRRERERETETEDQSKETEWRGEREPNETNNTCTDNEERAQTTREKELKSGARVDTVTTLARHASTIWCPRQPRERKGRARRLPYTRFHVVGSSEAVESRFTKPSQKKGANSYTTLLSQVTLALFFFMIFRSSTRRPPHPPPPPPLLPPVQHMRPTTTKRKEKTACQASRPNLKGL